MHANHDRFNQHGCTTLYPYDLAALYAANQTFPRTIFDTEGKRLLPAPTIFAFFPASRDEYQMSVPA